MSTTQFLIPIIGCHRFLPLLIAVLFEILFSSQLHTQDYYHQRTLELSGGLKTPSLRSIARLPNGDLLLVDPSFKEVKIIDSMGGGKGLLEIPSPILSALDEVTDVSASASGAVALLSARRECVALKTATGVWKLLGGRESKERVEAIELDDPIDLCFDADGFLFVLSSGKKQVLVFNPSGILQTWLGGRSRTITRPLAIDVSANGVVYVLDKDGPSVFLLRKNGDEFKSFVLKDILEPINEPRDICALPNGESVVLDGKTNRCFHFGFDGRLRGIFGSKTSGSGSAGKGVFSDAVAVMAGVAPGIVCVVDAGNGGAMQWFRLPVGGASNSESQDPIGIELVERIPTQRTSFSELLISKNRELEIPIERRIVRFNSMRDRRTLAELPIEDAVHITSNESGLSVVYSEETRELIWIDSSLSILRRAKVTDRASVSKVGGVAVFADGSVAVSDAGNRVVKFWKSTGLFDRVVVGTIPGFLETPSQMRVDSRGFLYVLDRELNQIVRFDTDFHYMYGMPLRVRNTTAERQQGTIKWFDIDRMDRIHVFNQSTSDWEVYRWDKNPECLLRVGNGQISGKYGIEDPTAFSYSSESSTAFICQDNDSVVAFQLPLIDDLHSAELAFAVEDFTKSFEHFERAIRLRFNSTATKKYAATHYREAAEILSQSKNFTAALKYLERAIALSPNDLFLPKYFLQVERDQLLQMASNLDYRGIEKLLMDFRDHSVPRRTARITNVASALDSILMKRSPRADERELARFASLYTELIRLDSSAVEIAIHSLHVARRLLEEKEIAGSSELEKSLAIESGIRSIQPVLRHPSVQIESSRIKCFVVELQSTSESISVLRQAVAGALDLLKPNNFVLDKTQELSLHSSLALCFQKLDQKESALNEYRQLLLLQPKNSNHKRNIVSTLLALGKADQARVEVTELMAFEGADVSNSDNIMLLARVEFALKNYSEACFQFNKVFSTTGGNTELRLLYAEALSKQNDIKEAQRQAGITSDFLKANLRANSQKVRSGESLQSVRDTLIEVLAFRAGLAELEQDYATAIECYRNALDHVPNSPDILTKLGKVFLSVGRVSECIEVLEQAKTWAKDSMLRYTIDLNYQAALQLRDQFSRDKPSIEIVDFHVREILPSLLRNYSSSGRLEIGSCVVVNNSKQAIAISTIHLKLVPLVADSISLRGFVIPPFSTHRLSLKMTLPDTVGKLGSSISILASLRALYSVDGKTFEARAEATGTAYKASTINWKDRNQFGVFIRSDSELRRISDKVQSELHDYRSPLTRNLTVAVALFSWLKDQKLRYASDPNIGYSSIEGRGRFDEVQSPQETLESKQGDCDDFVALYCSLLESAGIPTAFVDVPGHVFSAFELGVSPSTVERLGISRKMVVVDDSRVWVPVETTFIPQSDFLSAWKSGANRYTKSLATGTPPELVAVANTRLMYEPNHASPWERLGDSLPNTFLLKTKAMCEVIESSFDRSVRDQLELSLSQDSNNTSVALRLATEYIKLRALDSAERLLRLVLERVPDEVSALNNLGTVFLLKGNVDSALVCFSKATELDPTDAELFVNKARALLSLNRSDSARKSYQQAVEIDPSIAMKYHRLKVVLE